MSNKPKSLTKIRKQNREEKIFAIRVWSDYDEDLGLIKRVIFKKV